MPFQSTYAAWDAQRFVDSTWSNTDGPQKLIVPSLDMLLHWVRGLKLPTFQSGVTGCRQMSSPLLHQQAILVPRATRVTKTLGRKLRRSRTRSSPGNPIRLHRAVFSTRTRSSNRKSSQHCRVWILPRVRCPRLQHRGRRLNKL